MLRRLILIMVALIASVALSGTALSISVLKVNDGNISDVGEITTVNLTISEVPDGLAGYNITVSLSDTNVAEIISVDFPVWSNLNNTSSLPADSVRIKAADMNNQINGNTNNILLASVTIRGDARGSSQIILIDNQIDDDIGGLINVATIPGQLNVYLRGDLNNNGWIADAGDLVLMKRASIGEIPADSRYDLNNNGWIADAGDLVLMKRASIGEINL